MKKIKLGIWDGTVKSAITFLIISAVFIFFFSKEISSLGRGAILYFSTISATLLGLTFTAFAVISAFLPNIEKDFLKTKTFENFTTTFKITMFIELLSLLLAIVNYLLFHTQYYSIFNGITITLIFLTIGFMAILINRTFKVFKMTRNKILDPHT
jgi:hypothetical protein